MSGKVSYSILSVLTCRTNLNTYATIRPLLTIQLMKHYFTQLATNDPIHGRQVAGMLDESQIQRESSQNVVQAMVYGILLSGSTEHASRYFVQLQSIAATRDIKEVWSAVFDVCKYLCHDRLRQMKPEAFSMLIWLIEQMIMHCMAGTESLIVGIMRNAWSGHATQSDAQVYTTIANLLNTHKNWLLQFASANSLPYILYWLIRVVGQDRISEDVREILSEIACDLLLKRKECIHFVSRDFLFALVDVAEIPAFQNIWQIILKSAQTEDCERLNLSVEAVTPPNDPRLSSAHSKTNLLLADDTQWKSFSLHRALYSACDIKILSLRLSAEAEDALKFIALEVTKGHEFRPLIHLFLARHLPIDDPGSFVSDCIRWLMSFDFVSHDASSSNHQSLPNMPWLFDRASATIICTLLGALWTQYDASRAKLATIFDAMFFGKSADDVRCKRAANRLGHLFCLLKNCPPALHTLLEFIKLSRAHFLPSHADAIFASLDSAVQFASLTVSHNQAELLFSYEAFSDVISYQPICNLICELFPSAVTAEFRKHAASTVEALLAYIHVSPSLHFNSLDNQERLSIQKHLPEKLVYIVLRSLQSEVPPEYSVAAIYLAYRLNLCDTQTNDALRLAFFSSRWLRPFLLSQNSDALVHVWILECICGTSSAPFDAREWSIWRLHAIAFAKMCPTDLSQPFLDAIHRSAPCAPNESFLTDLLNSVSLDLESNHAI